jgi:hypothetical protein
MKRSKSREQSAESREQRRRGEEEGRRFWVYNICDDR